MRTIRITSRKYDGRLRDEYEALLYAEDAKRLVVYAPIGTMSYDRHTTVICIWQHVFDQDVQPIVCACCGASLARHCCTCSHSDLTL
jgi:hypothetical protein